MKNIILITLLFSIYSCKSDSEPLDAVYKSACVDMGGTWISGDGCYSAQ